MAGLASADGQLGSIFHRARAEQIMDDESVDGLLATSFENVYYLSGFISFSQRLRRSVQNSALLLRDAMDRPVVVAPQSDQDMAAQFPPRTTEIRPYGTFFIETPEDTATLGATDERFLRYGVKQPSAGSPLEALRGALRDFVRPGQRIGVEEASIAPELLAALRGEFSGVEFVPGTEILQRIRQVKTDEEVRRLRRAAEITETAIGEALKVARPGVTEDEMAQAFDASVIAQGGSPSFCVLAFGARGAYPNAIPSDDARLVPGDAIRFDVGCVFELYRADLARTAVLGEPSAKHRRFYDAILKGEDEAIAACRPGATAEEVFDRTVGTTREAGIPHYRRNHVGHGIGLDTYDPPLLGPGQTTVLEAGMVFEVETPYYELGFGGLQVEDTVLVTAEGPRLLTRSARDLIVVG